MFKNYFTVAFRNLAKHLGYSLINVLGLALGTACCVLIMLHVWDELSYGEKKFFGDRLGFVDSTFLGVFSFTLLQGDPKEALAVPGSMVMTRNLARKYFGNENPAGKVIKLALRGCRFHQGDRSS